VGIDLPPHLALHLVVKSDDAGAAEAMREKWAEILRLAGQREEIRSSVPQFDLLAALLAPKVQGDRLVLALDDNTAVFDKLVAAIGAPLEQARDSARRMKSMNNLKQIALAMHMYYDSQKHFPAPASYGADGKPLLSWRVYVLPYIEQKQLFDQFHLNEPWDSEHNKALIEKMPDVFYSPKSQAEKGKTNYLVPVGNGALYSSNRDEPLAKDVKDGFANTIMVVEVDDQHAVTWTRPDDLAFDPKDPKKGIGSLYEGGFVAAFCDGHVQFLSGSIDAKTLAALFTRAGGEVPGPY
jgi:prepilin-type processing-associated H-X9-DG protein